jgi:hypothetical protein
VGSVESVTSQAHEIKIKKKRFTRSQCRH